MKPSRVAYVLDIFPKLSETFVAGELAELRRRGVELRILSLLPPRDELRHEIIQRAGLDKLVEYDATKFADLVREFKPDLLHAHFAKDATAKARELSALAGVPFTFTAHGYDIHRKPPPDFRERATAAGAVVTVSEANAEYIVQTFGVPRAHLLVIPCGLDTERFRPAGGPNGEPGPPWIVCVARHVKVKNLGLLLDTCAELQRRGVRFRCAMVGDGPLRAELQAKRAELGLGGLLEMPGAAEQGDVLKWWQRATVGVLTSEQEGMPVSLMEAAACGVPVVATRVGGVPELVREGETGLLVPPGDPRALADALERLLPDTKRRGELGAAARRRAVENFSVRHQVEQLLAMWEEVLAKPKPLTPALSPTDGEREKLRHAAKAPVSDPFGAKADAELPTLTAALDAVRVRGEFKRAFPSLSKEGFVRPQAIRVTRHKPGRRAVVEYDVQVREGEVITQELTLIGKLRARRYGNEGLRLQQAIWNAGFDSRSADGISVPEPLGVIPDFRMWFQRKVPGVTAEEVFSKAAKAERVSLARRVAEAIHKLHRSGVPTEKRHTMDDELRILRECLNQVATLKPEWRTRLAELMSACEKLGACLSTPELRGVHRDFYPAQVIVEGSRLWLIDFDLYCLGDPGLDAGNFLGHVIEQALRERGEAAALADVERALEERFVELSGERARASVRAYTTLTLARHVFLSTKFPERSHLTKQLLELCEQRLR